MSTTAAPDATLRPHLIVATPCYGGNVTNYYALSAIKLQKACIERGIELSFRMLGGDALITRARGNLAMEFLAEPSATHLLFIDADIGFRAEQVFALLDADKDVVSAVYPMKIVNWDRIQARVASGRPLVPSATMSYAVEFLDPAAIAPVNGLAQVRSVGTGFMLIRRQVFDRMAEGYPEPQIPRLWPADGGGQRALELLRKHDRSRNRQRLSPARITAFLQALARHRRRDLDPSGESSDPCRRDRLRWGSDEPVQLMGSGAVRRRSPPDRPVPPPSHRP